MTAATESLEHIGETKGMEDHDFDLVIELSHRLESLWRYDQRIANAEKDSDLQNMWQDLKQQDLQVVERLRKMIAKEIKEGCF